MCQKLKDHRYHGYWLIIYIIQTSKLLCKILAFKAAISFLSTVISLSFDKSISLARSSSNLILLISWFFLCVGVRYVELETEISCSSLQLLVMEQLDKTLFDRFIKELLETLRFSPGRLVFFRSWLWLWLCFLITMFESDSKVNNYRSL